MLLDNNQYVEYSMTFKQDVLTFWVEKRIKSLFSSYFIDKKTDVMMNDLLDIKHPFRVYLDLLRSHVPFKLRTVSISQMTSRINYYLGAKKLKHSFAEAWKTTVKKEVCPWITQQIDYALQNKTPVIEHTMKTMRLGIFYMVVKNYLYAKNKKTAIRKNQNFSIEAQSIMVE